jgi:hypothetical protein
VTGLSRKSDGRIFVCGQPVSAPPGGMIALAARWDPPGSCRSPAQVEEG